MRKAQATLFIVVGLVLLLAVGAILLFLSRARGAATMTTADAAQMQLLQEYVGNCIDAQMLRALQHVRDTGGMYDGAPSTALDGTQVIRGVTYPKSADRGLMPALLVPAEFRRSELGVDSQDKDGVLGDVMLSALCSSTGINHPFGDAACAVDEYQNPPLRYGLALQDQIGKSIDDGLTTCVPAQRFVDGYGAGAHVNSKTVSIGLYSDQTTVFVEYDLTVGEQTQRVPFTKRYAADVLRVGRCAYDAAQRDTQDALFDIRTAPTILPSCVNLQVTATPLSGSAETLITVTGRGALADGTPMSIRFVRDARPPLISNQFTETDALQYAVSTGAGPRSCMDHVGIADPDDHREALVCSYDERTRRFTVQTSDVSMTSVSFAS